MSALTFSRYAPSGQPPVGMVSVDSQPASTVRVSETNDGSSCWCPRISPDCQTRRAWSPRYQPTRNAWTRYDLPVVDTCRSKLSPGSTLTLSVKPSTALTGPTESTQKCGSPGRSRSGTALLFRVAPLVLVAVALAPELSVQPAVPIAAATPTVAAAPRNLRRCSPSPATLGSLGVSLCSCPFTDPTAYLPSCPAAIPRWQD